ncbi:MAG: hypothetical protein AB7E36_16395 [Salinivirgaceae bacterium]
MKILKVLCFLIFFTIGTSFIGLAQFYFLEDVHDQIEIEFLKQKIETEANTTFFNLLKIKNPSNKNVTFITNFSYPATWSFMGEKNQQISLGANDSVFLPFRAAASLDAKGEIGYAIVASLTDLKGNTFKNEYSFVNIPKKSDIKFTPQNRIIFLDQLTKNANIELYFSNNGNTDEAFYIDLSFDQGLTTTGETDGHYKTELLISPQTDTMVSISVNFKQNFYDTEKQFHRINVKANTIDTAFTTSIWLKELDKVYINPYPDNYKMLSLELSSQNLFSDNKPSYSIAINGNLLFKTKGDLYYSLNSYGSRFYDNPWKYGRYIIEYSYKNFNVVLGDINANLSQDMYN